MNKQPWYHGADDVVFTCTREITEEEFIAALEAGFKAKKIPYVKGSTQVGAWGGGEPGDPHDLM